MKSNIIFSGLIFSMILLNSCAGSSDEYGKKPLELDNFDFKLNIEKFFQNEDIFRSKSEFAVKTEEYWIDGDSIEMGYIDYATVAMSQSRPLAKYAGINFESLGIITDWEDKNVIMAYASSDYTKPKDVESIIDKMKKEFGEPEVLPHGFGDSGVILKFIKGEKVAKISLAIPYQAPEPEVSYSENYYDEPAAPEKILLTDEIYAEIKESMKDLEEIKSVIFITHQNFDNALEEANSFSGDLTQYN